LKIVVFYFFLFFMINRFNLMLAENDSQLLISGHGRSSRARKPTLGQTQIFIVGGRVGGDRGRILVRYVSTIMFEDEIYSTF